MGSSHSTLPKPGLGHPEVFYRGVKAAKEGRFTVSELYFLEALKEHPGHDFWDTFTKAVLQKPSKGEAVTPTKDEEQEEEDAAEKHVGGPLDAGNDTAVRQSVFAGGAPAASSHAGAHGGVEMDEAAGGSDDAEKTESKAAGVGSMYNTKVVDIYLPLSNQLAHIMNFFRLLADIALTYLNLLSTTKYKEKVSGLAGRYCLFTISHTQILLHCLTLWKEDKFGDGGGFIDYDKKRNLKFGADAVEGDYSEATSDAQSVSGNSTGGQKWRHMDRTASLLLTMGLLEEKCRYYYLSFLVSYCELLIDVYPTVKEGRKQNRVYSNAMEHLEQVFASAWDIAKEYPNEYLSDLLMRSVPKSSHGDRDLLSSMGNSSHASNQRTLSLGNDQHRHLYSSGSPWSPSQSALIPLIVARNVRLSMQESVSRIAQAHVHSPAQRMSFYYVAWRSKDIMFAVPGCSLYLLQKSLPGFVPGKGTEAVKGEAMMRLSSGRGSIAESALAEQRGTAVHVSPEEAMVGDVRTDIRRRSSVMAEERHSEDKKALEDIKKRFDKMNTDLHLCDERTEVVLCLNEVANITCRALVLSAMLRFMAGVPEAATPYVSGVVELTSGLLGPDSTELHLMRKSLEKLLVQ